MTERPERQKYVILHHKQGKLDHWDFLFEVAGQELLRSFQLFAQPDAAATQRGIPCREIHAHRRKYLVFEGEISGGRGRVKQWDSGALVVLAAKPGMLRLQLDSAIQREHPEWVMHAQGGGDWLLRAAAFLPIVIEAEHMPRVAPPIDPLRQRVFRDGV